MALCAARCRFIPASAGNGTRGCRTVRDAGSSPRPRGTAQLAFALPVEDRFIPASAGNGPDCQIRPKVGGSSPRPRGTAHVDSSRCPRCSGARKRTVHPRVRGERAMLLSMITSTGSVHPRVRGERSLSTITLPASPVHPRVRGERTRINGTPAGFIRAASTQTGAAVSSPVHPRVRGERRSCHAARDHAINDKADMVHPRVRGERRHFLRRGADRFIPASAGNGLIIDDCFQKPKSRGVNPPAILVIY